MPLVAAAVCPTPPLLVPEVAAGAAHEMDACRAACDLAVRRLVGSSAELLVVVGAGTLEQMHGAGASGSLAGYGCPGVSATLDGPADGPASLPLSLTLGAWLLRRADYRRLRLGLELPADSAPDRCSAVGTMLARSVGRLGLLVMGDGSARRSERAPGYLDPAAEEAAEESDARAAAALGRPDPAALLGRAPLADRASLTSGRVPWQVLAGAAEGAADISAALLSDVAPYGVGYLVASWWTARPLTAARRLTIAVVGPTATGKSALAVELALALGGEVLNADAMQLYRGMDIGTAKVTVAERRGVPHHLLDIWDVTETASVAEFRRLGREVVPQVRARGNIPVVVGGSGLYVRALVDPDLDFPRTDAVVRGEIEALLARLGPAELHRQLALVDPLAAASILPTNGRRIVRALEVHRLTGRPFSATLPAYVPRADLVQVGLDRPDLDQVVEERVRRMFAAGFVEEVRRLVGRGLGSGLTARRALGYRQVLAMLSGDLAEDEAQAATVMATRRFVRRQRSWFRRDPRVTWLDSTSAARSAIELVCGR